ncbi:DUF5590 domain-containing protein [Lacticigenium naphthae]|uniref:cell wall elongation regulator TseB-like domain-containing protein n=1 Tax=Lacticigenium naphthae TaxID=515351 RepID=UPI0004034989|nr:DUF5590 domain-containing protein [Lacticigenium naphthae]
MKKIILGISVLLALFVLGVIAVYHSTQSPYNSARTQAESYVRKKTDLTEFEDFYWYNGEETFFAVIGNDAENKKLIAIIESESGKVTTHDAEESLTEQEAIALTKQEKNPAEILQARIGMENNEPVWEVSYLSESGSLGYYVLSMQNGNWIKDIENI